MRNHPLRNELGLNGKTVKERLRMGVNVTNTPMFIGADGKVVYVPNRSRRRAQTFAKKKGNNRRYTEGRIQQYAPIERIREHLKRITHTV